jgi:hypothetical protein
VKTFSLTTLPLLFIIAITILVCLKTWRMRLEFLASGTKYVMTLSCNLENMGRGDTDLFLSHVTHNLLEGLEENSTEDNCVLRIAPTAYQTRNKKLNHYIAILARCCQYLLRLSSVVGCTEGLKCFSVCVFYFHSYSPRPPFTFPPVGAAKVNSLFRKVMGALWRLDVLIFRYGGPFITTKPVFYGLSHILRNQSVIAELNEQSMDQIL